MNQKKQNLKKLGKIELGKTLSDLRENLRVLRFKTEGAKSKNVKESFNLKKQIARVLTEISKND